MVEQSTQDLIDGWTAKGMLDKKSVLERLDRRVRSSYAIRDEEWPVLRNSFDAAATEDGYLTEAAFISLLETKASLPLNPEGAAAGEVIFSMLAYLSSLPFPTSQDVPKVDRLSFADLTRALVWLFPERYKYIIEEGSQSRMRTAADHRRLLFQSLASVGVDGLDKFPYNPLKARELALRNAFKVEHKMDSDICQPIHDDDGDEIYHDLLDVLYSTQDEQNPALAHAPRDAFRAPARDLVTKHNLDKLYDLAIPTERLVVLVKLLLALQFKPADGEAVDLSQFATVAGFTTAGFTPELSLNADDHLPFTTWPMFDRTQKVVTPYLFDPLYRMLSLALIDTPGTRMGGYRDPPADLPAEGILTLPYLSQIAAYAAGSVSFGLFSRTHCLSPTREHRTEEAAELLRALETAPEEAVVLIGDQLLLSPEVQLIFGVFSSQPSRDGAAIQPSAPGSGYQRCAIFQLAPRQDVFPGVIGQPGWGVNDDDWMSFGTDEGGVSIAVYTPGGLMTAVFRNQVPYIRGWGEGENRGFRHIEDVGHHVGAFDPNPWRSGGVMFDASQIEVWSEKEAEVPLRPRL